MNTLFLGGMHHYGQYKYRDVCKFKKLRDAIPPYLPPISTTALHLLSEKQNYRCI